MLRIMLLMGALALAQVVPANADGVQGMRFITRLNSYSSIGYSAIWGYSAPNGREYALLGVKSGTSIVDITDESAIKESAFIPGTHSTWREMKVYKNYAYVVTDSVDSGIQIIDLSGLPASAKLVATYSDLPQNHTVWVDAAAGILYSMGGSGNGIVVLSLADPIHPVEISRFDTTYVHDAFFKNGRAYANEIMSKSFSIWDLTDLKNPKLIKRYRDANAPKVSYHNSWVTEDNNYLVTTEESTGRTVKIWDIRDELNVKKVAEWLPPNQMAHNVQIKGHYAYFSSYGGGIRVLDLADPTQPKEVAYWNRGDGLATGFQSVWGVFPFFKSGKIIASDMEDGLIVTQFNGAVE